MLIAAFIIVVVVVLYSIGYSRPSNKARQAYGEADGLLTHAESAIFRQDYEQATIYFRHSLVICRANGFARLEAECHYGMARIFEKRGNLRAARVALEKALANRRQWEGEKPNLAKIIVNMLESVNRRSPR